MDMNTKLVIVMIGLPARGKSYISRKLARFLNWYGINSKIFNQGVYRRINVGKQVSNDYFDEVNNQDERDRVSNIALDHLIEFMNGM
jgi:signal recognition particle GTPase